MLALMALDIKAGDEVIATAFVGATPVLMKKLTILTQKK
ncbi:hypothetical protein PT520_08830 [Aliarcobacter butzleri]|uniref:Uncharacterized protein n=1 Tax=Aliarcobacter butzleri TaxID=28197 RepID=A0AAW6VQ20_9BACT|nr:hypothetical protein [Aliarcobacter butzleri]MDK2062620.1 hypothetical protein [Aliarcobacter butzleri]